MYLHVYVCLHPWVLTERQLRLSCMVTQYLEMRSSFLGKSVAVAFTAQRGKEEPKKCSTYLLRLVFHLPGREKNSSPGSFVLPGSGQSESHWRKKHLAVPSGQRCRKSSRSSQRDRSYCNHRDRGFWLSQEEKNRNRLWKQVCFLLSGPQVCLSLANSTLQWLVRKMHT